MPNEPDDLLVSLRDELLDEQLLATMRQQVVAQGGAMLRRRHWQGIAVRVAAVLLVAVGAGWLYLLQNTGFQGQPMARVSTPNEPKPALQARRNEPKLGRADAVDSKPTASAQQPRRNEPKLIVSDQTTQRNKPKLASPDQPAQPNNTKRGSNLQPNEPEPAEVARFVVEPAPNLSRTVGDIPGKSPHRYTGEPGRSVPSGAPPIQTALVLARNEPKPAQPQWEVVSLQADGSAQLRLSEPKSDIVILWVTPADQEGEQQP